MGLYQLAEFPIQNRDGDDPTGAPGGNFYWPHVGLYLDMTFPDSGFQVPYVVALDGVAQPQSGFFFGFDSNPGWWAQKNVMTAIWADYNGTGWVGSELKFEPKIWLWGYTSDQQEYWPFEMLSTFYVKLDGRRLRASGNRVYEHRNGDTEVTAIGPELPFSGLACLPGRHVNEVMIPSHGADGNGGAIFYDTITNTLSKVYYIGEAYYFRHLFYVPEWQIFLTVYQNDDPSGYPWLLKIWSMEVRPTVVSEPEIIRGSARSGQVVTFRVQVTGNKNEPAENELVDWVVTSDIGLLLDTQSKTDGNGYATARVKIDVGETGLLTVEASVTC